MLSKLKEFQQEMIKYTETVASVLDVDIEIVDDRLIRISGTGLYKSKINESVVTEGFIYDNVIQTGQELVVLDICDNQLCIECSHYMKCLNKVIIAVPIKYNNRTIGVIGAISTDKTKKVEISAKIDNYLKFVNHICDLISMKIEEHEVSKNSSRKMDMMIEIIENVEKGVIILDINSKISYINNIALKKLDIDKNIIENIVNIVSVESSSNGHELLEIDIDNKIYNINAKIIPVYPYINQYDKIIIFDKTYINHKGHVKVNSGWGNSDIESIIGNSEAMLKVKERTKKLAKSNSTVLITGESGTGKELIARAIHAEGSRWNKPFIAINCAAIPENLLESELFGYIKGAFSGASSGGKVGKFELANEGVIFLDEIGDLSMPLQAKLLRVLQERKFARIGSNKLIDLDIRVIAATNKNLLKLVNEGKFRDDLYYRLNVIPINLPPLRERKDDIEAIMMKFASKYSLELGIQLNKIEENVMNMLINYNWPGNIRELENAVEYMMNLVGDDGIIYKDMLPLDILNYYNINGNIYKNKDVNIIFEDDIVGGIVENQERILSIKELELTYINKLLNKYGRDTKTKKKIAKDLGIGLATLYRKLEEEQ
ncbi:sigma54-dependent transcriptional regulator [Clostridioides difficile]|uniref:sigma-54-dependent Fis family transcriptional regulator n=1 Tax=Clostridioides difficile TaxID=1496 RepID=UPI000D1D9394|nr:sigma 54-interacting transcriptional regulator [Clostridioides difficile]UWD41361.1 sigma 54-interacting transcriptional regulator [Clostridioides difficile]UWD45005.1 sigma 54-interacting transcriptional regulator [Clostridioides difficile]VFF95044.1 sigma54-dependent transcriptional regulator [Clostridioides difficile]VIG16535.1 sigma54-dependent transcriptional regulator [Clostridioides difficile]HBE9436798.1 sigma 54-interacting transcriptional regulator [Clostridioides difficile]